MTTPPRTLDAIARTIGELYIDAVCDADCVATDRFYRELSRDMTLEEAQQLYVAAQREKSHATA
jgi:hypothetical protein